MRSGKKSIKRLLGITAAAAVILCMIPATAAAAEARSVSDAALADAAGSDTTSVHIFVIVLLMLALLAEVTVVLILVLKNFVLSSSSKTEPQQYAADAAQGFGYDYPDTPYSAGNEGYVLLRENSHEIININKAEFYLGKERAKVDYCITDNSFVSRRHARISVYDGRCYLCDLGSTNCTYVNGIRLSPDREVALIPGDRIGLSNEEFVFIDKPAIAS